MLAYVFQAALLCEECARKRINVLLAGSSRELADTGDSDAFPQGPYADGGGEADAPNHCDHCRVFLENPLTSDGEEYVREAAEYPHSSMHYAEYRERYAYLFAGEDEDEDEDEG